MIHRHLCLFFLKECIAFIATGGIGYIGIATVNYSKTGHFRFFNPISAEMLGNIDNLMKRSEANLINA